MKKDKLSVWYDKEGDYLEITLRKSKDSYFNEVKKDCANIIDKKSGKIIGCAIFNFAKRNGKFIEVDIPIE